MAIRLKPATKGAPGAKAYLQSAAAVSIGPAGGFTPADFASAYAYNPASGGSTQTVGIVDWLNDPNIVADVNLFDSHYGLPAETATSFRVLNQSGATTPLPAASSDTSPEIALDVESVRAVCNLCKIILLEANGPSNADLATAVNTAASLGATEISNSYGEAEQGSDASFRAAYDHPGIVITASTGDHGWYDWDDANGAADFPPDMPNIPAAYPSVIAVGGTALALNADGTRAQEDVWNENGTDDQAGLDNGASEGASGGGCSTLFTAPAWQAHVAGYASEGCGTSRQTGDIAADADPFTGFDVYDSFGLGGWATIGGTSLSSPLIAAMWGLAGGSGGAAYPAQSLYSNLHQHPSSVYDVTVGGNSFCGGDAPSHCSAVVASEFTGSNGNPNGLGAGVLDCSFPSDGSAGTVANNRQCNAGPGYDGPSGVGTPNGLGVFNASLTPGSLVSMAPSRLLDTRHAVGATGPVAAQGTVHLAVAGHGGVPASGVSAVVLNVTVTAPASAGYLTVFGDLTSRPTASNLNFVRGQTVPNLVLAPVGADGKVDLFNGSSGTVQIIADVAGFVVAGTPLGAGAFGSLRPSRLLDTRHAVGATGPVAAHGTVHLAVAGHGGVPASGVSAVVLNVTVTAPASGGYLTVFGDLTSRPTASNLNFVRGQTVPNLVVAPVGADGKVALYNGSSGTVQIIADVAGYFVAGSPTVQGAFGPLPPSRLLDTRHAVGATGPVAAQGTVHLAVAGHGGIPASGVSAVVLNVTVTAPASGGYLTVFGDLTSRPTASNLNFVQGQTVPNLVVAPVGADGKVALFNGSSGTVQIIADVAGYFRNGM